MQIMVNDNSKYEFYESYELYKNEDEILEKVDFYHGDGIYLGILLFTNCK